MAQANARPFRFGVMLAEARNGADWARLARKAEDLGYDTLLVADHIVTPLAAIPALTAAAMATTRLRVGSFVFANDFRHPVMLARDVATLDWLSGGRMELGIGAGWHVGEYQAAGIPFDSHAVRVERMVEGLRIIKGFFAGEPLTFSGKHYVVSGLEGLPGPVQRPHPPIMIGAGGRTMHAIAGREADIVSFAPRVTREGRGDPASLTLADFAQRVEWVRGAAGSRFEQIELSTYLQGPVVIADDARGAAAQLLEQRRRQGATMTLTEDVLLESPVFAVGSVERLVDKLLEQRERLGISYLAVGREGEADMDAFAPVVARLAGQ